jgi:hypothetical protein
MDYKPTIADVHTQPATESGMEIGRILHVGTARPRLMVAIIDRGQSLRAYAGVVFAYHEVLREDYQRLSDEDWKDIIDKTPPEEVPWLAPLTAPPAQEPAPQL